MAPGPPEASFVCLTADVIASRAGGGGTPVQEAIRGALARANRAFAPQLAVPFSITLGDEFQALFRDVQGALEAELFLRLALAPLAIRCGLGAGGITGPVAPRTAEMDGPCFYRSREALETAQGRRAPLTWLRSGDGETDAAANACFLLLAALHGRWSPKQVEALGVYLEAGTQTAAARVLGISQPGLRKRLQSARAPEYLEARGLLGAFLAERLGPRPGP